MKNRKKYACFFCTVFFTATLWAQENRLPEWDQQVKALAGMVKTDPEGAADGFKKMTKGKNRENVPLLQAIARVYLDAGDLTRADEYASQALSADRTNAGSYILSGDIAMAKKDVGTACGQYEQAMMADENCSEAYYKYARAYAGTNPEISVQTLLKLKEKHPEDWKVDGELAEAYYSQGKYSEAKQLYDEYMTKGTPDAEDYGRYAMLLYLNKDYTESMAAAQKGLEMDADNSVLKRLKMYDACELKTYDEAQKAAEVFFNEAKVPFVYLDYIYRGRISQALGENEKAIADFVKAVEIGGKDGTHPEIQKELSGLYEKSKQYDKAIASYKVYFEALGNDAKLNDLFLLGRLYYKAAADSSDSLKVGYLSEADSIFAVVAERVPESYLGPFWRARTNSMLDPETTQGLAKPYYEAALAILLKKEDASASQIIECESYLGYYYYVQKDYAQSKEYWKKILELDPDNATAQKALEGMGQIN